MGLEHKIGKTEKSSFSGALRELSVWDWSKAIASNAAGAALSGGLFGYGAVNVLTTAASFLSANYLLNRKKGFSKNSIQTDINFAACYTPSLSWLLEMLDNYCKIPLTWMAGYAASMMPFTAITNGMRYMIEKYSPLKFLNGIFKGELQKDIEYIIKDSPKSAKSGAKSALYLTGPVGASRFLLPRELLIAALFPLRAAYRYITGREPNKEQYNPGYAYQNNPNNLYLQAA